MHNRLMKISEMVGRCNIMADIGTDHGYLPMNLIQMNSVEYAIVTDISCDSLNKAVSLIKKHDLTDKMEARVGSGLHVIKMEDRIDVCVIAGMGGHLIADILQEGEKIIRDSQLTFVLQPMQNPEILRQFIVQNAYQIVESALVEEDARIYQIFKVVKDENLGFNQLYNEFELEFGKLEQYRNGDEKKLYRNLLQRKLKEYRSITEKLTGIDSLQGKEKLENCELKIDQLQMLIKEVEYEINKS